jgi:putative glutamine amidotransferase
MKKRDEIALRLSATMIEAGRPVFGICRGLQELNVLFDHQHDGDVAAGGMLSSAIGGGGHRVNSVHLQGIGQLGSVLEVEARADDGLIEAISAAPFRAPVLGVQWHPEWDASVNPASRGFFELLGDAARSAQLC